MSAKGGGRGAACAPYEFAPGVYRLQVGEGLFRANVYLVRGDAPPDAGAGPNGSWVLVDTGVPGCDMRIRLAAQELFGTDEGPTAILITHAHPDHVGSAADLARHWRCPVYLHPEEVRMIGGDKSHFRRHSFTLDRWLILPLLRLGGKRHIEEIMARGGLRKYARALDSESTAVPADARPEALTLPVPGLPGWNAVPTPGHTPGHVALFRRHDKVLLSGDAVVTKAGPFSTLVGRRTTVALSPWYFTWNRRRAKRALAILAALGPEVVAGGHGPPRDEADLAGRLNELAKRY